MSVVEAAGELHVSEAYVRRLLLGQRLYGIKVGPVWAVFPNDLDAFRQLRRPPGRPAKVKISLEDEASVTRVATERSQSRTNRLLRKPGRSSPR